MYVYIYIHVYAYIYIYIHTRECYSTIKRKEIGSLVETWMDLETGI